MPRGRAGLDLIPAARVAEAFKRIYSHGWMRNSPSAIGKAWNVSERTARRWQKTGLPLCYGKVWITREEWQAFEKTGQVPKSRLPKPVPSTSSARSRRRTRLDRYVSARSRGQVRP